MTVAEFLQWKGDGTGTIYELVDGVVRAQEYSSDAHGTIQSRLVAVLTFHLDARRPSCRVVTTPGIIPLLRSDWNFRIPDVDVTCAPNRPDRRDTPEPLLLNEVVSPSNETDTWSNIPLYATLPGVQEILLVDSTRVFAELFRRDGQGNWPKQPEAIEADGAISLGSIGFEVALREVYRGTHLEA